MRIRGPRPVTGRWKAPFTVVATIALITSGIALAVTGNAAEPASACTLVVPANPLTAQGLATPYELVGCKEANPDTAAFVQATVVDPATGRLSVYNPLVVDRGTRPAQPPVVPQLPDGGVVGIWFGFNGDNLTLKDNGGSLAQGRCVNGLNGSIFGQFAYCNAGAFFSAANAAIAAGKITVPPLGTAKDGQPCLTTQDFGMVDQDQSDNVTTTYLFLADGTTAQNTTANQSALAAKKAKVQANGSDEGLIDNFLNPALGCTPMTAPDLADPGRQVTSLALNELSAAGNQKTPVALVPPNDPMTQVDGRASINKTNLYRAGVNQPQVEQATDTAKAYCRNLVSIGVTRTQRDAALTKRFKSPNAADALNLFTFLAQRLNGAITLLGCEKLLGIKNPVTVVTNADGVAVDARFAQVSPPPSPSASPSARPNHGPVPSASASASPGKPTTSTPAPAKPSTSKPASPASPPKSPANATPSTGSPPAAAPNPSTRTSDAGTGTGGAPTGGGTTTTPPTAAPVAPADPAGGPDVAPTMTLGPVPAKAGANNPAVTKAANSMPFGKIAGLVFLVLGVLLGGGFSLRTIVDRRRRGWAHGF